MSKNIRDKQFDYENFPDTMAPRRFEIINIQKSDDAVHGHGVEMFGGLCIVERRGISGANRILGFSTIEDVKKECLIRWIDPPFKRAQENQNDQ